MDDQLEMAKMQHDNMVLVIRKGLGIGDQDSDGTAVAPSGGLKDETADAPLGQKGAQRDPFCGRLTAMEMLAIWTRLQPPGIPAEGHPAETATRSKTDPSFSFKVSSEKPSGKNPT